MSQPSQTAVKMLFALSRNKCFFPRCEEDLTRKGWKQVNAEIAHIKGEKQGSARWDESQPDDQRQGYENLMLLCPKHHKLIDRLEPDDYPVEVLLEMRQKHLDHVAAHDWCTEEHAMEFSRLAISYWMEQGPQSGLFINSARYGKNDTWENVIGRVANKVQGDQLTMEVTNETMGGDPLENVVKQLVVDYHFNGTPFSAVAEEGTTIVLPPS